MADIYQFIKLAETYIYVFIGLISFIYFRKLIMALGEFKNSIFGLEKDHARTHIISAVGGLLLMLIAAVGVFIFITVSGDNPSIFTIQKTPKIDLSATLTPMDTQAIIAEGTQPSILEPPQVMDAPSCQPGVIEWTSPQEGAEIRGKVELKGTANIENFGFYKYEYSVDQINWNALVVGTKIVTNDILGVWDTSLLVPGDYYLRLVVYDNQENSMPPCVVKINILLE
ncbi:MAG: hypothetical protein C0391_03400 [Anaerolinea sp.]|nr:hypothetical protein [Anaerolinea sp.]